MLHDPNWKVNSAHSLKNLIAWLETKEPDVSYDYGSIKHCGIAQYLRAMGFEPIVSGQTWDDWTDFDDGRGPIHTRILPNEFRETFNPSVGGSHTFGAALSRAKELERKL